MGIIEIILIGVGLAMDATAVSVGLGFRQKRLSWQGLVLPAVYFGGFQALMPLIGFYVGINARDFVTGVDHWVAFILLVIIGGKMLGEKGDCTEEVCLNGKTMLSLAVATSIDALAVGISLAFLEVNIWEACAVIGGVTALLCVLGVWAGRKLGCYLERYLYLAGGLVLIAIGTKILVEHLWF